MSLNIIFMGTPKFSVPILESIYNSKYQILAVYTQPPKKKSRGQKLIESPINAKAKKLSLQVRCPKNLDSKEEYNFIKKLSPDIVVISAYGKIIPSSLLNIPNIQFINVHASLLPKWRGAAPIQRSIISMEKETGISIMKVIPKLDAGPFMMQEKIKIEKHDNYETLSLKLSNLGSKLILDSLQLIEIGKEIFKDQTEQDATYAKKINKSESKINWNIPAKKLIAKINGLSPSPGMWFTHNKTRLKIVEAVEVKLEGDAGKVIDDNLTVACSKNAIKILQIQKEGKNVLKNEEFLLGYKIKKNECLN